MKFKKAIIGGLIGLLTVSPASGRVDSGKLVKTINKTGVRKSAYVTRTEKYCTLQDTITLTYGLEWEYQGGTLVSIGASLWEQYTPSGGNSVRQNYYDLHDENRDGYVDFASVHENIDGHTRVIDLGDGIVSQMLYERIVKVIEPRLKRTKW